MRPIGFSTGAIARQDFQTALTHLRFLRVMVTELSALRIEELSRLVDALPDLDLSGFQFVSFHAPSRFKPEDESFVLEALHLVVDRGIPVVVHPDVIFTPAQWHLLGDMLLIENMDKRKPIGRTARELDSVFQPFPNARFCFDVGHARQVDPTMIEAHFILERFGHRLAQVHISEVNTASRHDPLSSYAISAFQSVAQLIPDQVPVILETLVDQGQSDILTEIGRARAALPCVNGEAILEQEKPPAGPPFPGPRPPAPGP